MENISGLPEEQKKKLNALFSEAYKNTDEYYIFCAEIISKINKEKIRKQKRTNNLPEAGPSRQNCPNQRAVPEQETINLDSDEETDEQEAVKVVPALEVPGRQYSPVTPPATPLLENIQAPLRPFLVKKIRLMNIVELQEATTPTSKDSAGAVSRPNDSHTLDNNQSSDFAQPQDAPLNLDQRSEHHPTRQPNYAELQRNSQGPVSRPNDLQTLDTRSSDFAQSQDAPLNLDQRSEHHPIRQPNYAELQRNSQGAVSRPNDSQTLDNRSSDFAQPQDAPFSPNAAIHMQLSNTASSAQLETNLGAINQQQNPSLLQSYNNYVESSGSQTQRQDPNTAVHMQLSNTASSAQLETSLGAINQQQNPSSLQRYNNYVESSRSQTQRQDFNQINETTRQLNYAELQRNYRGAISQEHNPTPLQLQNVESSPSQTHPQDPRQYLPSQYQGSYSYGVQHCFPNTNPGTVNYPLAHPGYSGACASAVGSLPHQSTNSHHPSPDLMGSKWSSLQRPTSMVITTADRNQAARFPLNNTRPTGFGIVNSAVHLSNIGQSNRQDSSQFNRNNNNYGEQHQTMLSCPRDDPRQQYWPSQCQASHNCEVQHYFPNTNPGTVNYPLAHPGYSGAYASAVGSLQYQSTNIHQPSPGDALTPAQDTRICPYCGKTFKTPKTLETHLARKYCRKHL